MAGEGVCRTQSRVVGVSRTLLWLGGVSCWFVSLLVSMLGVGDGPMLLTGRTESRIWSTSVFVHSSACRLPVSVSDSSSNEYCGEGCCSYLESWMIVTSGDSGEARSSSIVSGSWVGAVIGVGGGVDSSVTATI